MGERGEFLAELHVPRKPGGNWHLPTGKKRRSGCRGVVGPEPLSHSAWRSLRATAARM